MMTVLCRTCWVVTLERSVSAK